METKGLSEWGDITVVIVYFLLVLSVGIYSLCRPNRGTVVSYFLAGRTMQWLPVGASLFSSNIGSEHFIGLAGTGAASGVAIVFYEWIAMPHFVLLAWLFLPVYIASGVYTIPEYMQKRFGGDRIRIYLCVLSIILAIVTKLAVSIFAGALFIQMALGWDMYLSIVALLVVTGLFTILGGLTAVIYTDTLQTIIMTVGALALTGISFHKVGGMSGLVQMYMNATPSVRHDNSSCGTPRTDSFDVFRDPATADLPWPGVLFHVTFGAVWYFSCDQEYHLRFKQIGSRSGPTFWVRTVSTSYQKMILVIVQRALAAKNLSHAKGGSILAGYLKVLPMFIMIIPGMISRALFPDAVACVDPEECMKYCQNPVGCSNIAYPKLVLEILPTGLRGLLMAVMLSAIMSSLTSIFNSAGTLFTMDIWRKARRQASERELLIVGRVFVLIISALSVLWVPLVKSSKSGQLFIYIQSVQGYLGTPIGPVFLFAVLWKRTTEKGAFWALVIGHSCGMIRMVMDFVMPGPQCGELETRPAILYAVHYTYFSVISFVVTSLVLVSISLITKPQDNAEDFKTSSRNEDIREEETVAGEERKPEKQLKGQHFEFIDPGAVNPEDERVDTRPPTRMKHLLYKVCGIPEENIHIETDESTNHKQADQFMAQTPLAKSILDINAFVGILVMAFLFGYFH